LKKIVKFLFELKRARKEIEITAWLAGCPDEKKRKREVT
jgi:hypothetical protein